MEKPVDHYQFYWDCDDWVKNFTQNGQGWGAYHPHYAAKVKEALAWLDEQQISYGHTEGMPFYFCFYDIEDVMLFKLRWGSGKTLEVYGPGDHKEL